MTPSCLDQASSASPLVLSHSVRGAEASLLRMSWSEVSLTTLARTRRRSLISRPPERRRGGGGWLIWKVLLGQKAPKGDHKLEYHFKNEGQFSDLIISISDMGADTCPRPPGPIFGSVSSDGRRPLTVPRYATYLRPVWSERSLHGI